MPPPPPPLMQLSKREEKSVSCCVLEGGGRGRCIHVRPAPSSKKTKKTSRWTTWCGYSPSSHLLCNTEAMMIGRVVGFLFNRRKNIRRHDPPPPSWAGVQIECKWPAAAHSTFSRPHLAPIEPYSTVSVPLPPRVRPRWKWTSSKWTCCCCCLFHAPNNKIKEKDSGTGSLSNGLCSLSTPLL